MPAFAVRPMVVVGRCVVSLGDKVVGLPSLLLRVDQERARADKVQLE